VSADNESDDIASRQSRQAYSADASCKIGEVGQSEEMDDPQQAQMGLVDQRSKRLVRLPEPRHKTVTRVAGPAVVTRERRRCGEHRDTAMIRRGSDGGAFSQPRTKPKRGRKSAATRTD
jgi:hypothetical protein